MVDYYDSQIPPYAILSHTWETEEVTYQDMQKLSAKERASKRGWSKIEQACKIALKQELNYIWVDTCCIDKRNSAELSEAINSMFQWYKKSEMCIAYLSDVSVPQGKSEDAIFKARWWTRGWTLQELIAPSELRFYSSTWQDLGSKMEWVKAISQQIGIPIGALQGDLSMTVASAAQKFSWAAKRQTTRIEDEAYCLLGIFDVNMPLLYGEGSKAFRRLQEEVIKQGNDLTIFAHSSEEQTGNLFAQKPADFQDSGGFRARTTVNRVEFSATNRGLRVTGEVPIYVRYSSGSDAKYEAKYFLLLGDDKLGNHVILYLTKIGAQVFHRDGGKALGGFKHPRDGFGMSQSSDCYILTHDGHGEVETHADTTAGAILLSTIPIHNTIGPGSPPALPLGMLPTDFTPFASYNHVRRMFLRRKVVHFARDPWRDVVIAIKGLIQSDTDLRPKNPLTEVVVLCDYSQTNPKAVVFETAKHQRLEAFLFADANKENSVVWQLLNIIYPRVQEFSDSLQFRSAQRKYELKVSFERFRPGQDDFHRLQIGIEKLKE